MRLSAVFLAASALLATPAFAANDQVGRGPVPDWVQPTELLAVPEDADGLVLVRRQDFLVHLDGKGESHHISYRLRILHPNALQAGNITLSWNPAAGQPTVHAITVHRDGRAIDVLANASFEILRREDQLETAMIDGILTAVLRVADLRVGDELEVSSTTPVGDPTLQAQSAGLLLLMAEPPPGRFHLGLSWDEGQQPNMKMTPEMSAAAAKGTRRIDFRFDNPAALVPPKDAPGRYAWQRVVEYSDFADWAAVSRRFAPLFAKAAELETKSPVREEAARIAATHPASIDRARAALKLVQQEVRYVYVGLGGGNLTPATADETWQRRYGDCKGKTALLLGLLAELGIEAEAVLANNSGLDDGFDERLPSSTLFDHVLVRARIDGKTYWLDGTMPPVVPPGTSPVVPYRWFLPLSASGNTLEQLPWQPPARPDELSLFEIDARAGFDKPARITNTRILRGIAGLQQQVQLSAVTQAQLLNGMRQQLVGNTWQTIDLVKWRYDQSAQASILTISGTGLADWDDDGDGARSMSLPGGGFSPPERRIRSADQDASLPYANTPEYECHVTTVRLPDGTTPSQWGFNSSFDASIFGRNYRRAFEMRDGSIRMVRGFRVEKREIDAATAQADNARIAGFDNSMAWVYFSPKAGRSGSRVIATVPATDEIDWTADTVPCLGPDKAG